MVGVACAPSAGGAGTDRFADRTLRRAPERGCRDRVRARPQRLGSRPAPRGLTPLRGSARRGEGETAGSVRAGHRSGRRRDRHAALDGGNAFDRRVQRLPRGHRPRCGRAPRGLDPAARDAEARGAGVGRQRERGQHPRRSRAGGRARHSHRCGATRVRERERGAGRVAARTRPCAARPDHRPPSCDPQPARDERHRVPTRCGPTDRSRSGVAGQGASRHARARRADDRPAFPARRRRHPPLRGDLRTGRPRAGPRAREQCRHRSDLRRRPRARAGDRSLGWRGERAARVGALRGVHPRGRRRANRPRPGRRVPVRVRRDRACESPTLDDRCGARPPVARLCARCRRRAARARRTGVARCRRLDRLRGRRGVARPPRSARDPRVSPRLGRDRARRLWLDAVARDGSPRAAGRTSMPRCSSPSTNCAPRAPARST